METHNQGKKLRELIPLAHIFGGRISVAKRSTHSLQ